MITNNIELPVTPMVVFLSDCMNVCFPFFVFLLLLNNLKRIELYFFHFICFVYMRHLQPLISLYRICRLNMSELKETCLLRLQVIALLNYTIRFKMPNTYT